MGSSSSILLLLFNLLLLTQCFYHIRNWNEREKHRDWESVCERERDLLANKNYLHKKLQVPSYYKLFCNPLPLRMLICECVWFCVLVFVFGFVLYALENKKTKQNRKTVTIDQNGGKKWENRLTEKRKHNLRVIRRTIKAAIHFHSSAIKTIRREWK